MKIYNKIAWIHFLFNKNNYKIIFRLFNLKITNKLIKMMLFKINIIK